MARKGISDKTEAQVLTASRRRCCLCYYLDQIKTVRRGQIAHLDRDSSNSAFENLAFLCLEHHDWYDSRTSQSKGASQTEVRHWRDKLYARYPKTEAMRREVFAEKPTHRPYSKVSQYDKIFSKASNNFNFVRRAWRYPLWQVGNQPEYFAYNVRSGFDGVCLIERVNLPDGRVVIVCIQTPGNPGKSITNCVETLAMQVCERFDIPADRLVWIEHYDRRPTEEWMVVNFRTRPPRGPFATPTWTPMTAEIWRNLRLRPKKHLVVRHGQLESKVRKLFDWPVEAIND
jgi:hypothetical protein